MNFESVKHLIFTILLIVTLSIAWVPPSFAWQEDKAIQKTIEEELSPYEQTKAESLLIEAQKLFLLEDYKRALSFLEQSIEIAPDNHAAYFKEAEIHLILKAYDKGAAAIDKAIELAKNNKYYYVLGAQIQQANNNLAEAAQYYERMLRYTTGHIHYVEKITKLYEEMGALDSALSVLHKVAQKSGLSLHQKQYKADLLIKTNRKQEALSYLEKLNNENPDNAQILYCYASLLSITGQSRKAIQVLESNHLNANELKLLLAENYYKAGSHEKQRQLLLQVYNDPEANLLIRTLLLGQWATPGNISGNIKLIDSLQTALEQDYPRDPIAIENGALLFSRVAQSTEGAQKKSFEDKSIARYKLLTRLKPGDFNIWRKVLSHYYQGKQWEALETNTEEVLSLFPGQVIFYLYAADAKMGLKESEEAGSLLRQALRMSGTNQELKSRIFGKQAVLQLQLGNTDKAITLFEQALKVATPNPETIGAYADLLTGTAPQKALRLIELVIASPFKNLHFIRIKAQALFNLSDYQQAHQTMLSGMEEYSEQLNGTTLELHGDILFKLNKVKEAVVQWKKAKNMGGISNKIILKIEQKQYY